MPGTAQPTHRINKKIDFQKLDFEHIFDDPSFFLNSQCSTTKTIEKNRENMLNHEIKVRGDVKLQFRAITLLNNVLDRTYNNLKNEVFRIFSMIRFFSHYVQEKKRLRKN